MKRLLFGTLFWLVLSCAVQAADENTDQLPLNAPWGITVSGNSLYVADTVNNLIRVVDIRTGKMNELYFPGQALYRPDGIVAVGSQIYVGDHGRISRIELSKNAAVVMAGSSRPGSADGVGAAASLVSPSAIIADGNYLYVADAGNRNVRVIEISTGKVTTLCGSGKKDAVDGPASVASLSPWGITKAGNYLYVADYENSRIRKIDVGTGDVSTLAGGGGKGFRGSGAEDGVGKTASFYNPWGIATDGSNLYVADSMNNKIRKVVIATGEVSTLAGGGGQGYNGAGFSDGIGTQAAFNEPAGLALDGSSLYVVDRNNNTIRKVDTVTGMVTTVLRPVYIATSTSPLAKRLLKKAERGDIESQYKLGELYSREADDLSKNVDTAFLGELESYRLESKKTEKLRLALQWYLKAAEQGHARSQYRVARLSGNGIALASGRREDFLKWYRKAAEQGIPEAEEYMGHLYASGIRVSNYDIRPEPVESFKWMLKAANHGLVTAQAAVGSSYEHGQGVGKDLEQAARWYKKAADKGYVPAQASLGCLLSNGSPRDYVQASMWLEIVLAAPQGWDYGIGDCPDRLAKVMTPGQKKKAKQLAREWSAKHHQVVAH